MKVRVMLRRPGHPHTPIALSDEVYDLDGDLDDPEARSRVLAKWRQGGARASYYKERVDPKELEAVVVDDARVRNRRRA